MLSVVSELGLHNVTPIVLNDGGNLTVHLAPYPIVARAAKQVSGHRAESWKDALARELRVTDHLIQHGVPVVPYSSTIPPGPYQVDQGWMTLWTYVEPKDRPTMEPSQAVDLVNELTLALQDFREILPVLGVWKNVGEAATALHQRVHADDRITSLLQACGRVNEYLEILDGLVPAHGDAHLGNLFFGLTGWQWHDFEDVSLMPRFWDLASMVGNTALFYGLGHPLVDYVLKHPLVVDEVRAFRFALIARAVMATTTNLSLALDGHGDLDFAKAQLARFDGFLIEIKDSLI